MITLRVKDLHHTYPTGVQALNGISFTLQPSECVALMGHNGAGKTTLVKHLNSLLLPTQGEVWMGDWNSKKYHTEQMAARVGYAYQNPDSHLFANSIRAEVEFAPRCLGFDPQKTREVIQRALQLCELDGKEKTHPYDLSWSQRRWVALAAVLAQNTPILILDEPTAGQDARGVERMTRLIQTLRSEGRSLLVITHDMEFCARLFERVLVLQHGQLCFDGSVRDLLSNAEILQQAKLLLPQIARLSHDLELEALALSSQDFIEALKKKRKT